MDIQYTDLTQSTEKTTLIEFPTDFQLKVMGAEHPDFADEILKAVQAHAPNTTREHITLRPSAKGNFVGATVSVYVENQAQLDDIYRAVTAHPMVKVVF